MVPTERLVCFLLMPCMARPNLASNDGRVAEEGHAHREGSVQSTHSPQLQQVAAGAFLGVVGRSFEAAKDFGASSSKRSTA